MAGEHDRTLFHYGTEDDETTVLSEAIGRYPEGMSLHAMLEDFVARLAFVESIGCDTRIFAFASDAWIIQTALPSFTADAMLIGPNFQADAVIVRPQSVSFTANAVFIEDVNC